MNYLNKLINWKYFLLTMICFVISGILIFLILNIKLNTSINAILEVDEDKNFTLTLNNSNIQQISENKTLVIQLNNKTYFLENIELFPIGNNQFAIKFENDSLFETINTKSFFNVQIHFEGKKLINSLFN